MSLMNDSSFLKSKSHFLRYFDVVEYEVFLLVLRK